MTVYIEEAHASDEWRLPQSAVEKELAGAGDSPISTHASLDERLAAAKLFVRRKGIQGDVVVDSMRGQVLDQYQAWPERLYIVLDGRIAYQGGVGPFHYEIDEVDSWLTARYGAEK